MKHSYLYFLGTKKENTIAVTSTETTKKEVLKSLASVFDPLGVANPRRLVGKMIYREGCVSKAII